MSIISSEVPIRRAPGANYYLWYDLDTKRFTVVTWDMNLSLMGSAEQGPFDAAGFGGPGRGRFGREANPLKQRFLDAPAFRQAYLRAYREVYDRLLASGRAVGELRRLEETIDDADGAASEAGELERTLRERTSALRSALS